MTVVISLPEKKKTPAKLPGKKSFHNADKNETEKQGGEGSEDNRHVMVARKTK